MFGLIELYSREITLRTINPANIVLNEDLNEVMFVDLRSACKFGEEPEREYHSIEPYSSDGYLFFIEQKKSRDFRDKWSIAVVILEILLSTKLVLAYPTYC